MTPEPAELLQALFHRAVAAADPMLSLARHLPPRPAGRVVVVGAGKASARMAEAVEAAWGPCEGLVITRYGHARPCRGIEVVEAAHPVPDAAGLAATQRLLQLLQGLGADDFVLVLMSGGASALLVAPRAGISLAQKQVVTAALLASGAPIDQMNTVRKHLSRIKGGQMAAAAFPARLLCLMISDVPGDDPGFIGSGPTVGETSTAQDALAVLARWGVPLAPAVAAVLQAGSSVIAPADMRLSRVENRICAAPAQSLAAAADLARAAGCAVRLLGDAVEGEAALVAAGQAAAALQVQATLRQGDAPVVLLSGGEVTVTRRAQSGAAGVGGPNAEFCLALAIALNGAPGIWGLACDTDGVDGADEVAGAVVTPETLRHAAGARLDPADFLRRNDAHTFFARVRGQVVTGPTLTNVNDFRAILVAPAARNPSL